MRARLLGLLLGAVLGACDAASPELGYDAVLQIPGAQFRPGPFPAPTGGPDAVMVSTTRGRVTIGELREKLHGALAADARAAILGLTGTDGTWIVTAGPPTFDTPDDATIDATYGVRDDTPPGPIELEMAAVDGDGKIGAPATVTVTADFGDPPAVPSTLVVGLEWDGAADLDIHVIAPDGGEAWAGHPNTHVRPPPGETEDPNAYLDGGILDHDGNMSCQRDGRPSEHVAWTMPPPPGTYTVRVEARSMCGDAAAPWFVEALDATGAVIGAARGISTPDDVTYGRHGAGAGITALTFAR